MRDFLRFARHFVEILHFVRGVLLVLLAALAACAALLVLVEDYTVGNALYFTLITAMTWAMAISYRPRRWDGSSAWQLP